MYKYWWKELVNEIDFLKRSCEKQPDEYYLIVNKLNILRPVLPYLQTLEVSLKRILILGIKDGYCLPQTPQYLSKFRKSLL